MDRHCVFCGHVATVYRYGQRRARYGDKDCWKQQWKTMHKFVSRRSVEHVWVRVAREMAAKVAAALVVVVASSIE